MDNDIHLNDYNIGSDTSFGSVLHTSEQLQEIMNQQRRMVEDLHRERPVRAEQRQRFGVSNATDILYDEPDITIETTPITDGNNYFYQQEYSMFADTIGTPIVEVQDTKEVNVMPKHMNKLKEWSISARALRTLINYVVSRQEDRYEYKFNARYEPRYNIWNIWNYSTRNIICTLKFVGDRIIIRYRHNSYYAPVLQEYNKEKMTRGRRLLKVTALPSVNLHLHRGDSGNGIGRASSSKESQLGYRMKMYNTSKLKESCRV